MAGIKPIKGKFGGKVGKALDGTTRGASLFPENSNPADYSQLGINIGTQKAVDHFIATGQQLPSTTSTYVPSYSGTNAAPAGNTVNPLYVAGGIAAAGMGAAALETRQNNPQHQAGLIESTGSAIVGTMDTIAGGLGTAIGIAGIPLMVGMVGGQFIAGAKDSGATSMTGKAMAKADTLLQAKFADTLSPKLGAKIGHAFEGAVKASAPVLDTMSHVPGLSGLHSQHLKNAPKTLGQMPVMHGVMQGSWVLGAGLGVYGIARSFPGQVLALRQLAADLTGQKLEDISTIGVLTGSNFPKAVLETRGKLLAVSGTHAVAAVAGLAMAIKSSKINGWLDIASQKMGLGKLGGLGGGIASMFLMSQAYSLPDTIAGMVEGVVGEPILAHYTALSEAQKAGQPIPAATLAEFILLSNKKLHDHGYLGKRFAMAIGEQYVAEGATIAAIVKENSDGGLQKRIEALQAAAKNAPPQEPATASFQQKIKNERQGQQMPAPVMPAQEMKKAEGPITARIIEQAALNASKQQSV